MKICALTGHKRSVTRAQKDAINGWRSVCRHCGAPMIRQAHGQWRLREEHEPLVTSLPVLPEQAAERPPL